MALKNSRRAYSNEEQGLRVWDDIRSYWSVGLLEGRCALHPALSQVDVDGRNRDPGENAVISSLACK